MMEIPLRGVPIQGEYMARPIQKSNQIVVNGVRFRDGTTAVNAYIVNQTGSSAYTIQDTAMAHAPEICFMVNADGLGALQPSQCYITATPFGGVPLPCKTIAQYRVSLFTVPNSVPRRVGDPAVVAADDYRWSLIPPVARGQAALNLA
jgi:hypothetical protein